MRVTARFILCFSRILYVSENAIYQGPRILSTGALVHEEKHHVTNVHDCPRFLLLSNFLDTCNLNYQSAIISVILLSAFLVNSFIYETNFVNILELKMDAEVSETCFSIPNSDVVSDIRKRLVSISLLRNFGTYQGKGKSSYFTKAKLY